MSRKLKVSDKTILREFTAITFAHNPINTFDMGKSCAVITIKKHKAKRFSSKIPNGLPQKHGIKNLKKAELLAGIKIN